MKLDAKSVFVGVAIGYLVVPRILGMLARPRSA